MREGAGHPSPSPFAPSLSFITALHTSLLLLVVISLYFFSSKVGNTKSYIHFYFFPQPPQPSSFLALRCQSSALFLPKWVASSRRSQYFMRSWMIDPSAPKNLLRSRACILVIVGKEPMPVSKTPRARRGLTRSPRQYPPQERTSDLPPTVSSYAIRKKV